MHNIMSYQHTMTIIGTFLHHIIYAVKKLGMTCSPSMELGGTDGSRMAFILPYPADTSRY